MLTIHEAAKRFGDFALRVEDISLRPGGIYGLVGHNGAGKSTFLKIVAGLIPADEADIRIDGRAISKPLDLRRAIGFVPDKPALYDWMTVAEYARFCAQLGFADRERMQAALDCFVVPGSKLIRDLSHGNRSKVGLAIALARATPYILMDEPLSGLDMRSRDEVLHRLHSFVQDATWRRAVLLSTHSMTDLEQIVEEVIIFRAGSCVLQATWSDICTQWMLDTRLEAKGSARQGANGGAGDARANIWRRDAFNEGRLETEFMRTATPLEVFLALG